MNLKISDEQIKLLIETLAVALVVKHMKREDSSDLQELIKCLLDSLKEIGKEHIFHKVFHEIKKT